MHVRPPLRHDLASFARLTGWAYFPIAFFGRLPFAMMIVGILSVVATVRDSVAEAGIAAACAGLGTAALGPVIGGLADRFTQRSVLIVCSVVSIAAVVAFLGLVMTDAPLPAIALLAFAAGGTTPQVAPFSRSRLVVFAGTPRSEPTRDRAMSMVMSYESVMDEASFVLGPVLVGVLTTFIAPWAPLAIGAALTATVVIAFAVHPSAAATAVPHARSGTATGPAFSARVVALAGAMLLVGAVFGSVLTALTEFMAARGASEQTGIIYGAMSAGAIVVAVSAAAMPKSFSFTMRWAVFAALGLVGVIGMTMATDVIALALALFLSGCGIGAVLVTLFSLGAQAAPHGRSTTVLTTLQSSLVVGQALATAAVGIVAAAHGATVGFLVTVGIVVWLGALALVYRVRFEQRVGGGYPRG